MHANIVTTKHTTKGNIAVHEQNKHEGIRHLCQQCDYEATQLTHLHQHIKSKHEGKKHSCQQYDYQASDLSNFRRHIKNKHRGNEY